MKKKVKVNKTGLFGYAKKGYDVKQVEDYVKSQESEMQSLKKQLELVEDIKKENERLACKLVEGEKKENEIKEILAAATEKANDIKTDVKLQYALEIERLKIFQAKWTNSYEELKDRYRFDKDTLNLEGVVADATLQIEQLLYKDFGIKLSPASDEAEQQFRAEAERLSINQDEINKLIGKLKAELKKVS